WRWSSVRVSGWRRSAACAASRWRWLSAGCCNRCSSMSLPPTPESSRRPRVSCCLRLSAPASSRPVARRPSIRLQYCVMSNAPNAQRVIDDLRELAARTSTADGAQRLAWGPVWREAREWFRGKISALGLAIDTDSAGNNWVTLPGASSKSVLVASHLDSVPNGGWLDGCLGVVAGLEALRMYAGTKPPVTLRLVDWADEEGARFGRSLLGSAAAAGSLKVDEVRHLVDRQGTKLVDALQENGVALDAMLNAHAELKKIDARAYLELHIEQGPVLESMNKSTGVVLGTFGVERHMLRFTGQAAHSGSTPIPMRRDAFLAAAQAALAFREIAKHHSKPGAGV